MEAVLAQLAARGLLDERRLVESYVAARQRKGFGPIRIRQELRHKGIPEHLIDSYLPASEEWGTLLAAVHAKRFGSSRPVDRHEQARHARFLEQRGFPAELIARFLWGGDDS